MFGHLPQQTLAEVLRLNNWNMERTVEALLSDGAGAEDDQAQPPPPPPEEASRGQHQQQQPRRRGKMVTLPDDFLRIPGGRRSRGGTPITISAAEQLLLDEQLARQLQQQDAVESRYQQHRRGRVASLPQPPQQAGQGQRRPRVASAPGYPSAGMGTGRAPSPSEGMEKLGKKLGQVSHYCGA